MTIDTRAGAETDVWTAAEARLVATARLLAADSVQRANSGHPGTAIALAPLATLLFRKHLRHDPRDPQWAGRDRFVLSCGHASILLYVQLHLSGYDVTLDDLREFRRHGSRTPGHPEFGHTAGIETTTGPLGQGLATAVGMAMGFAHEKAVFDPGCGDESPFDRRVWVLASDGDLQEGISYEAGALAARLGLDNLTVVYDDNDIQIEGDTRLTTAEDAGARFRAQGWHVRTVELAESGDIDIAEVDRLLLAGGPAGKPRLLIVKSQIAYPSPNAVGTAASHGAPLGEAEVSALRSALGREDEAFTVPADVRDAVADVVERGRALHGKWKERDARWRRRDPVRARQHDAFVRRSLPTWAGADLPGFAAGTSVSTRDASGAMIQFLATALPGLWGGSADLAEPNRTTIDGGGSFLPAVTALGTYAGTNIHWGVREHAMAAAMNGIALSGGWRVFGGTFLVFSDYQRPALRLAALMGLPVVHVWSHDSVALGQDGPTHQPIEHLASLRAIPGFAVIRPADANETVAAWIGALDRQQPAGLVLARQAVSVLDAEPARVREGVLRGGYAVVDVVDPDVVVVATGSEVSLALRAAGAAAPAGLRVRVVSLPCREWFLEQDGAYRSHLLPPGVPVVVVEAASPFGWRDLAPDCTVVGIDEFGLSAPAEEAMTARGMTVQRVRGAIEAAAGRRG